MQSNVSLYKASILISFIFSLKFFFEPEVAIMISKYLFRVLLVHLICVLLTSQTYAGLFDRMMYMMMKNRRRTYVPFPASFLPFANYIGGPAAYPYSAYTNLANLGPFVPYSSYLANLLSLSGLGPLRPWDGINPYYGYLNYADLNDLRQNSVFGNYLTNVPQHQASNHSEIKEDKKLSSRSTGPILGPVNGLDRKRLLVDGNFLFSHKPFRPPFTFPFHDEYLHIIR